MEGRQCTPEETGKPMTIVFKRQRKSHIEVSFDKICKIIHALGPDEPYLLESVDVIALHFRDAGVTDKEILGKQECLALLGLTSFVIIEGDQTKLRQEDLLRELKTRGTDIKPWETEKNHSSLLRTNYVLRQRESELSAKHKEKIEDYKQNAEILWLENKELKSKLETIAQAMKKIDVKDGAQEATTPLQEKESGLISFVGLTIGDVSYRGTFYDFSYAKQGAKKVLVATYHNLKDAYLCNYLSNTVRTRYENAQRVGQKYAVQALGFIIDSEKGLYCCVMQYMEFGSLLDVFANKDLKLTWDERRQLALDVCSAFEYLHGQKHPIVLNYVHCRNFYVGENLRAKIADLSYIDKVPDALTKTRLNSEVYGSPELVSGRLSDQSYTIKNDVYGAGIVLWAIAKRKEPTVEEKGRIDNLPADCPKAYKDVIKGLLAFEPKRRMSMSDTVQILSASHDMY